MELMVVLEALIFWLGGVIFEWDRFEIVWKKTPEVCDK